MFDRFQPFVREHRGILLLVLLLFAARLLALAELGIGYTLDSDDASYILSGIRWAETGAVTMHNDYPSAQIMPGMTVLIGLFAKVFGTGTGLWLALKLLWAAMGAASGWFIYRAVDLLTPPPENGILWQRFYPCSGRTSFGLTA